MDMDIDRRRSFRLCPGWAANEFERTRVDEDAIGWLFDVELTKSLVSCAARQGSEPATEPDVVLSRRNKPITDFLDFGFDSPPSYRFFVRFYIVLVFPEHIRHVDFHKAIFVHFQDSQN